MAFINEYISDEDMEKYNIRAIWAKFDHIKLDEERDILMGKYSWTIDRERDVFFIPVEWGREEYSNEITCIIGWQTLLFTVLIANSGSSLDFPNKTGCVTWDLLGINKPKISTKSDEDIVAILKEALTVYQLDGIRHPMLSYSVKFNF